MIDIDKFEERIYINYLESDECKCYDDNDDLYYEKKMLKEKNAYISVSELVKRFIEVDKYFDNKDWNLKQILNNINMIIPVEYYTTKEDRYDG